MDRKPRVFVTQIPHRKDAATGAFVPTVNINPASEFGELVVLMPPRASFFATTDLTRQLQDALKDYSDAAGDSIVIMGDPIIMAAACAVLGKMGTFTVLRWDKKIGRYSPAKIST